MVFIDDCAEMLCDFGLTRNQARVYLEVVRLGVAPVGKISNFSKVRREDVYRVLPKLEKMGLIERILGTPVKIRALPVEDALAILVKNEQEKASKKVSELSAKKEQFLKTFKAKSREKVMEEDKDSEFSLISGRDAILNKIVVLLKHVKNEIDMMASRKKLCQILTVLAEPLQQAIRRGARIRIIAEMPEEEDPLPRLIEENISPGTSVKLKYAETLPSHLTIFDDKEMLVSTTTHGELAENPVLWTNSGPLIEPLQKAFEDLWHSSINWANFKTENEAERLGRFIRQLKPTDHVIFVYESPESKYHVLFNYIKCGLEAGEATLYICSDASPNQIRNAMRLSGIDVEKHEKTGALRVLPYTDFYIINGKFSIPNTLALWEKFYKDSLAKGFKGLRITGETACFFKHNMVQELVEYEKALHRTLEIPMVAICSYRADKLKSADNPINLYRELVRAHGTVVFTGTDESLGKLEIRKT